MASKSHNPQASMPFRSLAIFISIFHAFLLFYCSFTLQIDNVIAVEKKNCDAMTHLKRSKKGKII